MQEVEFSSLLGQTIAKVDGLTKGSECVEFVLSDGRKLRMYHDQDCCESVSVEDVCGDPADLIGAPLLLAEAVSNAPRPQNTQQDMSECEEWTFYKLATMRGAVTIRWYGDSNGYYSTSVSLVENGGGNSGQHGNGTAG